MSAQLKDGEATEMQAKDCQPEQKNVRIEQAAVSERKVASKTQAKEIRLTGHVLRKDCLTAPIPTADFAKHSDQLMLLPDLGIVAMGAVGSVILFGSRDIDQMRDIALPSDSSTSKVLLRWLLKHRGLDPKCVETGPDLNSMLDLCDGALLIGDRALAAASQYPELVSLDLGGEWTKVTGLPMVFGVFACRKDAPLEQITELHNELIQNYQAFNTDSNWKNEVISSSSQQTGITKNRMPILETLSCLWQRQIHFIGLQLKVFFAF